jgi:hypothetical protein
MYRSYQFLAKVKVTSTGKLLDSLPKNDVVAELCSCLFIVANCRDPIVKTPSLKQGCQGYSEFSFGLFP